MYTKLLYFKNSVIFICQNQAAPICLRSRPIFAAYGKTLL